MSIFGQRSILDIWQGSRWLFYFIFLPNISGEIFFSQNQTRSQSSSLDIQKAWMRNIWTVNFPVPVQQQINAVKWTGRKVTKNLGNGPHGFLFALVEDMHYICRYVMIIRKLQEWKTGRRIQFQKWLRWNILYL